MRSPIKTFLLASMFAATTSFAQSKIILPVKDNIITYEGNINMSKNFASDYLCSKVKSWVIASSESIGYKVQDLKDDGCTINLKMAALVEKEGTFSDVDYSYNMIVKLQGDKIVYTIDKIYFNKSGHSYNASEVYERYYKDDPYTKQSIESKKAALRRHEYLLQKMNAKIFTMIHSLRTYLAAHDMVAK